MHGHSSSSLRFIWLLGLILSAEPVFAGAPALGSTESGAGLIDDRAAPADSGDTPIQDQAGDGAREGAEKPGLKADESSEEASSQSADDEPMALNYYVESRAYGVKRETEPPGYVTTMSESGLPGTEGLSWLDFGADHRTRFEFRDDDIRRAELTRDTPFLLRSRAYIGIKELLDPFRMVVEFQDSRSFNSRFAEDDRDFNENEIIQFYGELYFKDALGKGRPMRLQAGRMAFEYLDRRLISRNPWRNTTNNFQGFRAIFGQDSNDWSMDVLAVQPVERRLRKPDVANEEEWLYGLIGHWRRWSKIITLEPYYLIRDVDRKGYELADREIHTMGLRGYGMVGKTGWDYEMNTVFQFGDDGGPKDRAFGLAGELGYLFDHKWKPRVSGFFGYASGDHDPLDKIDERFDRHFGFARPWSSNDYIIWENVIAPKLRFEFQPHEKIRLETGYHAYWLASDSDSWANARRRDRLGDSGDFMGQELDARVRYQLDPKVEIIVGYAHFMPGPFVENTGAADDSDFLYIEASIAPFKKK